MIARSRYANFYFSVQSLKRERKSNDVSEQDLLDYMLSLSNISEDNELKQRRLAETIRNLGDAGLGEVTVQRIIARLIMMTGKMGAPSGPRGPQIRAVMRTLPCLDVPVAARGVGHATALSKFHPWQALD